MKLPSLSFLIPAYNDESTIEQLIRRAIEVGRSVAENIEVLVVDDASTDDTGKLLDSLEKKHKELRVIHNSINLGYGGAVKLLYYFGKSDWLFSIPGDFQIDPSEVVKLVDRTDQADMILGLRKNRMDTMNRKRQSNIYNTLLRYLFGIPIHDINSVRLMKRSMMQTIRLTTNSAFVDAELAIRSIRMGYTVIEVPIEHKERLGSSGAGGKVSVILPTIGDMVHFFLYGS